MLDYAEGHATRQRGELPKTNASTQYMEGWNDAGSLKSVKTINATQTEANNMEFGVNGNAIDLYEIWSKDGQTLLMSAWFACKSDADRAAYLMDGIAEYQLTGIARPE